MEPETNPTPGTPPQTETPNVDPQPEAPQTPVTPPVTDPTPATTTGEWPGAFGAFKHASAATKVNGWTILTFNVLAIVISSVGRDSSVIRFIGFLVSVWAQLALVSLYLAGARKQEQSFVDAAKVGVERFVDGFIATFLTALILALSFLALVVPFFFVLPRLQLVSYFLIDRKLGPIEAIKASWNETKGYSLKVWGAIAVSILFAVLILAIVGIYLLFMYQTVFALLYLHISAKKAPALAEPAVAPTTSEV